MAPNPFFDSALARLKAGGYRPVAWRELGATLAGRAAETRAARPDLVREARRVEVGGACLALLVGAATWRFDGVPAWLALALPLAGWILLCEWARVELGLVRHPLTGARVGAIGLANWMTLYRGWASVPTALVAAFAAHPTITWVGLCLLAGFTDLFDGTVARRLGTESRLGRLLDPVLDAFFFSTAGAGLARWGLVPWWVALLVAARYFVPVAGGFGLMLAGGRTLPVRHTPWGQRSTMAIAVALFVAWTSSLWRLPPWVSPALYAVAIVTMGLALLGIARRLPPAPS